MGRFTGFGRVGAVVAVLSLGGCDENGGAKPPVSRGSFQADYLSARGALDGGAYDKAQRRYADLLPRSGPATARVRLEYAHSLLRAGKYESAAMTARQSAAEGEGLARSSALAVQGIAEHELALAAMADGRHDRAVLAQLTAAGAALDEALKAGDRLDPVGGLQARLNEITTNQQAVRDRMNG